MKIPFTIEDAKIALALKMGRVVTKEGYAVEILDWDFKKGKYEHFKIQGKFMGSIACWDGDGKYYIHSDISVPRLDLEIEIYDDSP
jgi:hypothetical protein